MRSIDAELTVTEKGKGIVTLPPDIEPGEHKVTITINDELAPGNGKQKPIEFLVIEVDNWPENFSTRREDMYSDDGR